ncbi:MAG TPA: septal ring lytic transglycosylase RlpA family protein, partial [Dehalococcoidia bacterium]|nr:septal ring lytic transglycosylase RlpA family protein [Dehalococcoidia bacterium]
SHRRIVPPAPPQRSTVGVASWYGPGFNGKHTASGEVYNQEDLTAASTTLPLGTRALVTNLENGRSVEVRINDRGPFVKARSIDLSHGAALALGIVNPGTARVRIDVIRLGPQLEPGYFVQVGSFSNSANAQRLGLRLSRYFPDVRVEHLSVDGHALYRVRMGAFPDHAAALSRASQTAQLGLTSIIERQ